NRRQGDRRPAPRAAPGNAVWYVLGFLLLLALAQALYQIQSGETISYSDFKVLVREDKVQEVTLSDDRLHGILKPFNGEQKGKAFAAIRVTDAKLPEELEAHGVKYTGEVASRWLSDFLISWLLPVLFIVGLMAFFLRRLGAAEGGIMSFAR